MSPSKAESIPSHLHVIDFLVDDEDSSALTVYNEQSRTRLHVIADKEKLRSSKKNSRSSQALGEYYPLLEAYKDETSEPKTFKTSAASTKDSGIHIPHDRSAEEQLHAWLLTPLATIETPKSESEAMEETLTLDTYFNAPTSFYELRPTHPKAKETTVSVTATELEPTEDLITRMQNLTPSIPLPKYILKHGAPWFTASDLEVLESSSSPPPYHPTRVRGTSDGKTYFFKAANHETPQVTKRELCMLHRCRNMSGVRTPTVEGLVRLSPREGSKAIGFLQSEIEDPVPLTNKLSPDVSQDLRDGWAQEVESMKEALHENGMVWGDAKADNFLVDTNNKLWIIDFGGSYTEGWVDPEVQETQEGDDQGVEKIVGALVDPVHNTMDRYVDSKEEEDEGDDDHNEGVGNDVPRGRKRSAPDDSEIEDDDNEDRKKARIDKAGPEESPLFVTGNTVTARS